MGGPDFYPLPHTLLLVPLFQIVVVFIQRLLPPLLFQKFLTEPLFCLTLSNLNSFPLPEYIPLPCLLSSSGDIPFFFLFLFVFSFIVRPAPVVCGDILPSFFLLMKLSLTRCRFQWFSCLFFFFHAAAGNLLSSLIDAPFPISCTLPQCKFRLFFPFCPFPIGVD